MERTMSESFTTPASRKSIPPLCPLKRQMSEEEEEEEPKSPAALEREPCGNLQPRELDMDQHVSFGSAEEDKYVERGEDEEEEVPATQVYNPPDEDTEEEGEVASSTPPAETSSASPVQTAG